jgi:hypothetical protein
MNAAGGYPPSALLLAACSLASGTANAFHPILQSGCNAHAIVAGPLDLEPTCSS